MKPLLSGFRQWIAGPRERTIRQVRQQCLTYLGEAALRDLWDAVVRVEHAKLPGAVVEAGTALGGSAVVLARAKARSRPLWLYDTFGQIPPPSARDGPDVHERYRTIVEGKSRGIGKDMYYGYQEDLQGKVVSCLTSFGRDPLTHAIHLVKGLYQDTLRPEGPIALAHIDCDWYESVMVCLQRIGPWMITAGVVVIDDYDAWSGCRQAVDDYLADHAGWRPERRSRLHLVRE